MIVRDRITRAAAATPDAVARIGPLLEEAASRMSEAPMVRETARDVRSAVSREGTRGLAARLAADPEVRRGAIMTAAALRSAVREAGRRRRMRGLRIVLLTLALGAIGAAVARSMQRSQEEGAEQPAGSQG